MQSLQQNALSTVHHRAWIGPRSQFRRISLTGAIERGLRKGQRSLEEKRDPWRSREGRPAPRWTRDDGTPETSPRWSRDDSASHRPLLSSRDDGASGRPARWSRDDGSSERPARWSRDNNLFEEPEQDNGARSFERAPHALPYTTAASEFIYGMSAINAALRARRRKLHKLYIHREANDNDNMGAEATKKRAADAGLEVQYVTGPSWRQLFDRTTEGRPHNGHILEVSPVPMLPVLALRNVAEAGQAIPLQVGQLSAEDVAITTAFGVQAGSASLAPRGLKKRFPLILLLDRVTDLGNLGAIIRSAYYLGVEAVVLLDHGTAPLSAVTIKASVGAAELMPILKISNETGFITASKANGWHFVAAVAPADVPVVNGRTPIPEHEMSSDGLDQKPTVIMLGNEAEGLRPRLARMSNSTITIQDSFARHQGIDSLNVSVAAGILMYDMLRPFLAKKPTTGR